jgi:hypothetical protein
MLWLAPPVSYDMKLRESAFDAEMTAVQCGSKWIGSCRCLVNTGEHFPSCSVNRTRRRFAWPAYIVRGEHVAALDERSRIEGNGVDRNVISDFARDMY